MDILSLIRKKTQVLQTYEKIIGLDAVITHIEIAERHLIRGKDERDDNLYTDVIYRANHAFEGILKEAYTVLAENNDSKITPFEIENYLASNNVFKQRVMVLFTNYRQEWRNPSTHDYQLFFTEQEAFLAIVSVSAFVNILLDQMIEQVNFKLEKERTKSQAQEIKGKIDKYSSRELLDKITQLLLVFSNKSLKSASSLAKTEAEILGMLSGFVSSVDKSIFTSNQRFYLGSRVLQPDIIFSLGKENLILELKVSSPTKSNIMRARDQLISYLKFAPEINNGIVFFFPSEKDVSMVVEVVENVDVESASEIESHLAIIYPRKN
jgi:hypothetical protein